MKRLIDCYLSEKSGLIAVGITTALVEILKSSFVGSQVIMFDGLTNRTRFLYNTLQEVHGTLNERGQTSRGEPSFSRPLHSTVIFVVLSTKRTT